MLIRTAAYRCRWSGLRQLPTQLQVHRHHSTVDADDVQRLSNFAVDWWNPNGPVAPLHTLNVIRVPFIRDGLLSTNRVDKANIDTPRPLRNVNILEVGCGAGILTEQMARIHANVTGIDPSEQLIEAARKHLEQSRHCDELTKRITYRNETIEEHVNNTDTKYDAVVVSEVLEHVSNKREFLRSCTAPLAVGGSMFITTFNKTNLSWLGSIVFAEHLLRIIPEGTHEWDKFISPTDTKRMLEDCGCSTVVCNGFMFEFWKKKWIWTDHHQFSYALHAIKNRDTNVGS